MTTTGRPAVGMGIAAAEVLLDRADPMRSDPSSLAQHLADKRSRLLLLVDGDVPLRDGGSSGISLALLGIDALPRNADEVVLLGVAEGSAHFAATASAFPAIDARHAGGYGRYTTLAGFVEPGESLEAAVAREVREECDVAVEAAVYVGSQPWPFPSSLMVGFVARAASTAISVDGKEIAYARWFTRGELDEAMTDDQVRITGLSISSLLIDRWRSGTLPAV